MSIRQAPPQDVVTKAPKGLPFSAVIGVLVGLGLLTTTQIQLIDVDLYWHLLAGEELSHGARPDSLGLDWSFSPTYSAWTSTQWLGELALFKIHALGGWAGLAAFRTLSAGAAIAASAWATLRGRPVALAAFPFTIAAVGLILSSQERPQQVTAVGAALLSGVLVRGLDDGRRPRWWLLLPLTALWANIHGGWILAPAVCGLVALGRVIDHGPRDRAARGFLVLGAATLAAGLVSPSGLSNLTVVLRFRELAGLIKEWGPVTPTSGVGWLTMAMLGILVVGWARSPSVPRSEILTALILFVFGWTAFRNVAPALVLLAPLAAQRLDQAFPTIGRQPEPPWSVPLGIAAAVTITLLGLATLPAQQHLPVDKYPVSLAEEIGELPPGQRVLNDYNVAGLVLYFGGTNTRVGIDGRADRYGADYIRRYLELVNGQGDWRALLDQLDPTSALLREDAPLASWLEMEQAWTQVDAQDGWVLIRAPQEGERD